MDCASALDRPARVVGTKNNACCRVATLRRACAIALTLCVLVACGNQAKPAPPSVLGTPKSIDEVTGIWRTIHQNTLEFRKNGTFVLITTVSNAMAGNYSLSEDRITFSDTKGCGDAQGTYRIRVSSKDRMELTQPDDTCGPRKLALADPYVYARPDFS